MDSCDLDINTAIGNNGYAVMPSGISAPALDQLINDLERLGANIDLGARGGVRDAFRLLPALQHLATGAPMWTLASAVLGRHCAAVRAIVFDKTPDANWKVSWHQDVTSAVREQRDAPGFGPWTKKAGILHVQPPAVILEQMLTLRLHLDACGPGNGPVRVLPGSHRSGRLSGEEIDAWRSRAEPCACVAERGEILAMRPLLLHASSPSMSPQHRRVIHFEYAGVDLPHGVEWFEAWRPRPSRSPVKTHPDRGADTLEESSA
jgi:ectoine hydroxylase-related dioxygenase (phytanoyl-CoA dioxygenase family)